MGTPFMGEIRMMSFNFAPAGWAQCNGGLMPINQNQALFSLLGTTYGGNGSTNFALPDLRGRIPMHFQTQFHTLGERAGEAAHTITTQELPTHTHNVMGTTTPAVSPANDPSFANLPTGKVFANPGINAYATQNPPKNVAPETVANVGGSQPHNNMSPYLVINFCIALQGQFPSHS